MLLIITFIVSSITAVLVWAALLRIFWEEQWRE